MQTIWGPACQPSTPISARDSLVLQNLFLLLFPSRFQAIWSLRAYEKNKNKKFIFESMMNNFFGKWKGCDLIKNVGRYRKMAPSKRVRKEDFRYSMHIQIDCWNITRYSRNGIRNLQNHFREIRVGSKAGDLWSKQTIFLGRTKRRQGGSRQTLGLKASEPELDQNSSNVVRFRSGGFH